MLLLSQVCKRRGFGGGGGGGSTLILFLQLMGKFYSFVLLLVKNAKE